MITLSASPDRLIATRLRTDAQLVALWLADGERRPARWQEPDFVRRVARVRRHLAPIRSVAQLTSSFGREAMRSRTSGARQHRGARPGATAIERSPVELAYAIRWLELRGRRSLPPLR